MPMKYRYILLLTLFSLSWACVPDMKEQYALGQGLEKDSVMPDPPKGDRSNHQLSTEDGSLREIISGKAHEFSVRDQVYLRSAFYNLESREDGEPYLDLPKSPGEYRLFFLPEGSRYWFRPGGEYPMKDLVIPYSQFYKSTTDSLRLYPMYAETNPGRSDRIVFKEVISAVGITISGEARLASVHLENKAAEDDNSSNMAGVANYDPERGYVLQEGVNFVNLNCTEGGNGVAITPGGKTFYLLLAPGNYKDGLRLTVTDMDHKGQVFDVPAFTVEPGKVYAGFGTFNYAPPEDLLFFEHFDNFVWGGNVKGRRSVSSYAPDALTAPASDRTGAEEAFVKVGTATPGSALIQANWNSVSGWTVGERPAVSQDYVKSRNIGSYAYLYRCQEYQGCLSVGAGDATRGGVQPFKKLLPRDDVFYGIQLSFDICLRYRTQDQFCTRVTGSGIASRLVVDGETVPFKDAYGDENNKPNITYNHSFQNICSLERSVIKAPTSDRYSDGWHHVEVTLNNLNELSEFGIWGYDTDSNISKGAFIDNLEIRYVPVSYPQKHLRVLLYNIQYGMWADQGHDFENFVEFVKKYDPDVCVFCEASSGWNTNASSFASPRDFQLFTNRQGQASSQSGLLSTAFTNSQWEALAKRWGHNYHAVSAYRDEFPQVITSKTEITTINRIFSGPDIEGKNLKICHGGGHFQITSFGKTVNMVTLHLYPHKSVPEGANNLDGYKLQRRETHALLSQTISRTDCGSDWLVLGDTNAISPLDENYYSEIQYSRYSSEGYMWDYAHTEDNGGFRDGRTYGRQLYDMVREGEGSLYKGDSRFIPSTGGTVRFDIIYGSESMRKRVTPVALSLNDSFCKISTSPVYDPDSDTKHPSIPSDHRPILVDFDMSK